jgi:hypothetical protein
MMYSYLESVICDMFYIHPYGEMIGSRNENKCKCKFLLATCFHVSLLLSLFFDPEYGDMSLQNVG